MKQGFWQSLIVLAVLIAGLALVRGSGHPTVHYETALERINRTNTIRCGYVFWAPYLSLDPKTGAKSGVAYDFMTALGEEMGIRVEWVEETGWGSFQEGLNAGRYDMMCSPIWASGKRARSALLIDPVYTIGLYAYARADDQRFDKDLESVNSRKTKIAVIEGDATQAMRLFRFPNAEELALSSMTNPGELILSVAGRKADIALENAFSVEQYNKTADIKMKTVGNNQAVRFFACTFAVKSGETDLESALNASIAVLFRNGVAGRIIQKYPGIGFPNAS